MEKKLSLCMIVKNEEKMLAGCLESVKNIADEMIILDTGSTDKTLEVAQKFSTEIHHFDWTGDFSEARNESIKYATGNWILWLDADERLNPASVKELHSIIDKTPTRPEIFKVNIKNYQKGGDYYYLSDAHRLFTNQKGITFSGRIHEQISPSLKKTGGVEHSTNIEILHHGYNLEEKEQNKKNKRNRELLEKMVRENPDYAYGHYTLAQNYALTKNFVQSAEHFKKALALKQLDSRLMASLYVTYAEVLIELEKYDEAHNHIMTSLEIEKMQNGAYYLLFKIADKEDNFISSEKWLKKLYDINQELKARGKKNSTDVIIEDEKILQTLANLYGKNKKPEKFHYVCQEILKLNPESRFANRSLINYHIEKGEFQKAFQFVQKIGKKFQQKDEKYLDFIATIFIKNQQYKPAIYLYDVILGNDSNNIDAMKKLVGLLAKIGKRDEAEKILVYYQQKMKK